jgi:hypothetical protein
MSKADITELKKFIQLELKTLNNKTDILGTLVASYMQRTEAIEESINGLKVSVMDLQEVVLRTDDYIQKELFMNLRDLDIKNKRSEKRFTNLENTILKKQ